MERPRAQLEYYERGGSQTIAYGLGNKSGSLLQLNPAEWGEKNRALSRMYLAHALLVSDVMVSLKLACRQHGIRLLHEDELNLPVAAPLHWRVKLRDACCNPCGNASRCWKVSPPKKHPDHFGRGFLLMIKIVTKFSEIAEPA